MTIGSNRKTSTFLLPGITPIAGMSALLWLLSSSALIAQETFLDTFNSVSYSNNDGTRDFSGNWEEFEDDNDPDDGRIRIRDGQLYFRDIDERSISRTLDLSNTLEVILTLDYEWI